MTERDCLVWLLEIRRMLEDGEDVRSLLNEVVRYLIEFHCPSLVAEARAELERAAPKYDGS